MNHKIILGMATLCVASMIGCAQSKTGSMKPSTVISPKDIISNPKMTSPEKAEALALAGERLVAPDSFMLADEVLDMALNQDPSNKRAQLYKRLIAPAMATKGILTRIKPIAERNEESKRNYEKYISELPKNQQSEFLLAGSPDLKTESDIQNVIQSITSAQNSLRMWFKENKDLEIELNINEVKSGIVTSNDCAWKKVKEEDYHYYYFYGNINSFVPGSTITNYEKECVQEVKKHKMNRADHEAAQQVAAGYQIHTILLNAYSVQGSLKVIDRLMEADGYVSTKKAAHVLKGIPEFGVLRDKSGIQSIIDMGIDAVAGARWAKEMQSSICKPRPGHVFNKGLCMEESSNPEKSFEKVIHIVETALTGGAVDAMFESEGKKINTQIVPSAVISNPVEDLKSLNPQFSAAGGLTYVADDTLGGLFPNRDANEVLELNNFKQPDLPYSVVKQ